MSLTTKLDNRREIELAEGVYIHLRPVGLYPRLLARAIDWCVWTVAYLILQLAVSLSAMFMGGEASQGFVNLTAFVMIFFYDPLFESSKWSATPGKLVLKLRVVRRSGAPVGFGGAFLRGLLFWIDGAISIGTIGSVAIMSSRNSQRLGDMAADTLVVYRTPPVVPDVDSIPSPPVRPGVLLQREEQLAFIGFADRLNQLSPARQKEVTAPLYELEACRKTPNTTSFALGVARWLAKEEK